MGCDWYNFSSYSLIAHGFTIIDKDLLFSTVKQINKFIIDNSLNLLFFPNTNNSFLLLFYKSNSLSLLSLEVPGPYEIDESDLSSTFTFKNLNSDLILDNIPDNLESIGYGNYLVLSNEHYNSDYSTFEEYVNEHYYNDIANIV